jgi:hypothetical protein
MNCGQRVFLRRTLFWRSSATSRASTSRASDQASSSMFFCDHPAEGRAFIRISCGSRASSIRTSNGLRQYLQWPEDPSQSPAIPISSRPSSRRPWQRWDQPRWSPSSIVSRLTSDQSLTIVIPCRARYSRLSRLHFVRRQMFEFAEAQKREPRVTCRRQRSHKCSE